MPFLLSYPAVAWLLPVVTLPIIFHLFLRLRRQVREFPSLMFFMRIDPRLSAKRKVHEWLILLLRCLFLGLLILALARPLLGLKSSGEHVARLVLIDNSGSMAASATAGVSKLTLAERATEKLMATSHSGDAVAVQLMIPDPTSTLPHGFDAAPATLRDGLEKLVPGDGAPLVPKAIRQALATLDTAKASQRELHILTDLQQKNWSRGDMGATVAHCRIIVHRLESAPVTAGSVSVDLMEIPTRPIPAGRITPIRVALQNHGPAVAHVRLDSTDDADKNVSREMEIPPDATAPATLTFSFANPGFHWAQVWVEGDAATTANRAELGFWTTDVQKVLFVGGKDDFAALPYAVSPGGNSDLSGITAVFIGPEQLAESLAAKPLAVVLTWENTPQDGATSQALQAYVRQGGTLFLVPGLDAGASTSRPTPAWIEASLGALVTAKEAEPVVLLQDADVLWRDLRDADGRPKLGLLRAFQYQPVKTGSETGSDWLTLISSAKGGTLLARRNLDHGHIFASGLAFTSQWSSLPLKGGFVVMMQNAIFGDQSEHLPVQSIHAGEDIHFDYPEAPAAVKSLAGSALDWHGEARDFEGLPRAGVFAISQRDNVSWVTASGNIDEADPHFLPRGKVPLLRDMPHEVVSLVKEDDITQSELVQRSGISLYRWLLLVGLLVLLVETWLANERSSDLGTKLFGSLRPSASPAKTAAKRPTVKVKVKV